MVYLILAVLSSALISIVMRLSSDKISGSLSMLAVNYFICSLLSAGYTGFNVLPFAEPGFGITLFLGILSGVLFLVSFMLLQSNTQKNGIVLSSIFMKLGLLVPMALSVVAFKEIPNGVQVTGFIIAVTAIVIINIKKDKERKAFGAGLIVLLIMGGSADSMSKVFERLGAAALSNQYFFYTFTVALIICTALVLIKKERPGKNEILFGVLIGIPNFFSSKFLLGALNSLPAVVVYPTFSVATMLVVTLTGAFAFKERLSKVQWFAIAMIVSALIMLQA